MNTSTALAHPTMRADGASMVRVALQCPVCGHEMQWSGAHQLSNCDGCGFEITNREDIYRALPHDRMLYFRRFIEEYQSIREREGRGSVSDEYYLALPFHDVTGNNAWQWSIRARTFRCFENKILPRIAMLNPAGADILDIGAGNGWFSYRMALHGHHPVAVDLADSTSDGLGAARHYISQPIEAFPCFQAEMDHLPFAGGQFDAIIFNASFHYSEDYASTLTEALRCLRRPGYLVIADSPLYRREESGRQMVAERQANFRKRFGFPSDSLPSCEYLTPQILADLGRRLNLVWHSERPWYGLGWALRPIKARIQRKREPSKFYLLWARVER